MGSGVHGIIILRNNFISSNPKEIEMKLRMSMSLMVMIAVAVFITCHVAHAQGDDSFAPFIGSYTLTTPPAVAAKTIEGAITSCTEEMSMIKRPIARTMLKRVHHPFPIIKISKDGDLAVIKLAEKTFKAALNGQPTSGEAPDGKAMKTSHFMSKTKLVQQLKTDRGMRTNTFSVSGEGKLTFSVKVTSPELTKPIQYKLRYKK
jgi:hypothetical protein